MVLGHTTLPEGQANIISRTSLNNNLMQVTAIQAHPELVFQKKKNEHGIFHVLFFYIMSKAG